MSKHVTHRALAYAEGRLSETEREVVAAHLAACAACRAEVEDVRHLADVLGAAPRALDASLRLSRARVWARVRSELASARAPVGRTLGRTSGARLHGRAAWAMALAVSVMALTGLLASPLQAGIASAASDPPVAAIQTPGASPLSNASAPAGDPVDVSRDTTATLALGIGQTPAPIPNP